MYDQNHLARAITSGSDGRHDAPFLINGQTEAETTYGQFWANAERMAAALVALGLRPGYRVAVQAQKAPEMLELYVGTVLAGGVFLPLNTAYTADEIAYFLDDASPHVFVCDPAQVDGLSPVAQQANVTRILTLGAGGDGTLIDQRDAQSSGFKAIPRGPRDLAAILYTSGTTGRSKGAMLTHRALASNSMTLCDYWRFSNRDVLIHALPIYHTHGLFVATNVTMMAGGAAIFLPSFDADAIIEAMPSATALMGVPTFYTRLLKDPRLTEASRNMRLFVSGSAPLLAETHAQWSEVTGHAILERYGMTETNMNTSNPYDGARRAGTVGLALPGVEVKVCEPETGAVLPEGQIGVLEVRGDNVFAGYWGMPDKTAEELRPDGWFITGDLAMIDAEGYVTIVGRSKDLIITGGFNVYPKEVEAVIDDLPGVEESAVIGVPHDDFGEAVVAVVVAESGAALDEASVLSGLAGRLAKFKQPKCVVVVEALPRNTMGKVQKNVMRQIYAGVLGK
ncbi:malonyl-CoA synthase [Aliiroseovarius sediminis]|uniref:malonate--CoA ligase n=1 Tax=Aliiroseovarius sediminis TaxID=2925839 RepID=UPI001F567E85|nr:malonyl-CoA synthase [Aliiroseovarius sediminis]MCI2395182.1 malonyl-CoA synthase [Aliiroseovarius sediminis]